MMASKMASAAASARQPEQPGEIAAQHQLEVPIFPGRFLDLENLDVEVAPGRVAAEDVLLGADVVDAVRDAGRQETRRLDVEVGPRLAGADGLRARPHEPAVRHDEVHL